jgi:putative oxidoreductase
MNFKRVLCTEEASITIMIRLMIGVVFLSEELQKFLFADDLGIGRFQKIDLPNPEFLSPLIATFEILCGSFILLGLITGIGAADYNYARKSHGLVYATRKYFQ